MPQISRRNWLGFAILLLQRSVRGTEMENGTEQVIRELLLEVKRFHLFEREIQLTQMGSRIQELVADDRDSSIEAHRRLQNEIAQLEAVNRRVATEVTRLHIEIEAVERLLLHRVRLAPPP